jgi:hypothetical protein
MGWGIAAAAAGEGALGAGQALAAAAAPLRGANPTNTACNPSPPRWPG